MFTGGVCLCMCVFFLNVTMIPKGGKKRANCKHNFNGANQNFFCKRSLFISHTAIIQYYKSNDNTPVMIPQ